VLTAEWIIVVDTAWPGSASMWLDPCSRPRVGPGNITMASPVILLSQLWIELLLQRNHITSRVIHSSITHNVTYNNSRPTQTEQCDMMRHTKLPTVLYTKLDAARVINRLWLSADCSQQLAIATCQWCVVNKRRRLLLVYRIQQQWKCHSQMF